MNDIIKAVSILRKYGLKEIILDDNSIYRLRLSEKVEEFQKNFSQYLLPISIEDLKICGVKVKWEKYE